MSIWYDQSRLANRAEVRFASRFGGFSLPPFDELNVASWVGDQIATVDANLARLQLLIGVPLVAMKPAHGIVAIEIKDPNQMIGNADILITEQIGLALLAASADCLSLVATATTKPLLIVAHIGWRGAAAGITDRVLKEFRNRDVAISDIEVIFGSAICGNCYQVSVEVQQQVLTKLPAAELTNRNHIGLDLRVGVADYLEKLGVKVKSNLPCSFESRDFYSYRRDNVTGRNATIAWLV